MPHKVSGIEHRQRYHRDDDVRNVKYRLSYRETLLPEVMAEGHGL